MAIFLAAAVLLIKKSVALHLRTENLVGSSFFVYNQYLNQHKLGSQSVPNESCSYPTISRLFLLSCWPAITKIACYIDSKFQKSFLFWLKPRQSINQLVSTMIQTDRRHYFIQANNVIELTPPKKIDIYWLWRKTTLNNCTSLDAFCVV